MLFPLFAVKMHGALKLISWKHSYKRLNEEYEIAQKKKQALDNLYTSGRISQSTHDSFSNDITTAINEIEKQQKDLLNKMDLKITELQGQIKTLEMLLANYEIQHVVGEIDEDTYQHEITLLSTGLETAKHELDTIKEAAIQLCPPVPAPAVKPAPEPTPEPIVQESAPASVEAPVEETVAPAVEVVAEPVAEPIVEAVPEPVAEAIAEPVTEPVAEPVAEAVGEPVVEAATEPVIEIAPEPVIETPVETAEATVPEQAAAVVPETPEVVEIVPQEPQIIEEVVQGAHPTIAPKEAHPEVVVEPIVEQENAEEAQSAAEASVEESSESQNS